MVSRTVGAVICAGGMMGAIGPAPIAEGNVPVPHRWTFQVVARTGSQHRAGFPAFTLIQDFRPLIDDDGSVAVRYQASNPSRSGILVFDAATGGTRTIAERSDWFDIAVEQGWDFHGGQIAFPTLHGTIEVWSKEGQLIRTIMPGGTEQIGEPFLTPKIGNDGSIAYMARPIGAAFETEFKYIIETFGLPMRSQLRVAASTPNSSYSRLRWPAINHDLRFASMVEMRLSGATQLRRWEGSPLPVQPVVVATQGAGAGRTFTQVFDTVAMNGAGRVAFWGDEGDGVGLFVATDELHQTAVSATSPAGLREHVTRFAPSLNDAGLMVFGEGYSPSGHNYLVVTDGTDSATFGVLQIALQPQPGDAYLSSLPSFLGAPKINARNQIVFLARLTDQSTVLVIASPLVCPADFNKDEFVDPDDLADFITCFFLDVISPGTCERADFNGDGFRDPDDLAEFITVFFTTECQ